jgi:hypothetical protein
MKVHNTSDASSLSVFRQIHTHRNSSLSELEITLYGDKSTPTIKPFSPLWRYSPNLSLGLPPWNSPFHFGLLDLRHSVGLLGRDSQTGTYFIFHRARVCSQKLSHLYIPILFEISPSTCGCIFSQPSINMYYSKAFPKIIQQRWEERAVDS